MNNMKVPYGCFLLALLLYQDVGNNRNSNRNNKQPAGRLQQLQKLPHLPQSHSEGDWKAVDFRDTVERTFLIIVMMLLVNKGY